ncbi:MAG: hypothetical protein AAGA38_10165 [Pseudomonadota bacterium]
MRPLLFLLPAAALAACEPNLVGFDKYPVGSSAAAIDAREEAQAQAISARRSAPSFSFTSKEMRRNNTPVSQNEAAALSMTERKSRDGIAMNAGGQSFTVTQVNYDGYDFLVAHADRANGSIDQSEALKSMVNTVSPCAASGPAWRAPSSYAIALNCL